MGSCCCSGLGKRKGENEGDPRRQELGAKSLPVLCRDLGQESARLCVKTIHPPAEAAKGGRRMDPGRPLVATMSNYT